MHFNKGGSFHQCHSPPFPPGASHAYPTKGPKKPSPARFSASPLPRARRKARAAGPSAAPPATACGSLRRWARTPGSAAPPGQAAEMKQDLDIWELTLARGWKRSWPRKPWPLRFFPPQSVTWFYFVSSLLIGLGGWLKGVQAQRSHTKTNPQNQTNFEDPIRTFPQAKQDVFAAAKISQKTACARETASMLSFNMQNGKTEAQPMLASATATFCKAQGSGGVMHPPRKKRALQELGSSKTARI